MTILVVGSVAYDSVKTPAGSREDALGGSAVYFSISGSFLTPVSVIAVVGDDFLDSDRDLLRSHRVDMKGLERRRGKTFRWSGAYDMEDVNSRETLSTELNVFAEFSPRLSREHRLNPYVFLANTDPELQLDVLNQMAVRPRLIALDTMDFWISLKRSELTRVVQAIDVLFLDEGEARQFSGEANLTRAARHILAIGPHTVVIKRGEHGVLLFKEDSIFAAPAFPLDEVVDPTGAGDSFAGGFVGYLAATGDLSLDGFRRATVLGSVMGSFAIESFSVDRISSLTNQEIEARYRAFGELTRYKKLEPGESLPYRDDKSLAVKGKPTRVDKS